MYDRVLVPTDGGAAMEPVYREAADLADLSGADLHAVSVVDGSAIAGLRTAGGEAVTVEAARDRAKAAVERAADVVEDAGVEATTEVRTGPPHEEILDAREEAGCDVVVMGTHGRSGLDRVLLGSVAERVIRLSEVPVVTVPLSPDRPAVPTADAATAVARDAAAEAGHDPTGLREDPYRESTTWVVPLSTAAGAVNVHVEVDSGETRVAQVG
jgi:nucleotide-binding universal stress UspA family protein